MEKASWGWTTYTWNSKSMGQLHLRGIARQTLQTGGGKKKKRLFFSWFDTNGWTEACLVVRKNTKRQPSPRADGRSRNSPLKNTHTVRRTNTHTFVQVVRLIGRCEEGCAGHRWQGKHELELTGSLPPWRVCSRVQWTRQRERRYGDQTDTRGLLSSNVRSFEIHLWSTASTKCLKI